MCRKLGVLEDRAAQWCKGRDGLRDEIPNGLALEVVEVISLAKIKPDQAVIIVMTPTKGVQNPGQKLKLADVAMRIWASAKKVMKKRTAGAASTYEESNPQAHRIVSHGSTSTR